MSLLLTERASTWLDRAARDEPPWWVLRMRSWAWPVKYCVTVNVVGAVTLLLRPFWPHATGTTYDTLRTVSQCWPLALSLALGIVIAACLPRFGGFMFVPESAVIRGTDALHPLSVVPIWLYIVFVLWQLFVLLDIAPVVDAARIVAAAIRRWEGRRGTGR